MLDRARRRDLGLLRLAAGIATAPLRAPLRSAGRADRRATADLTAAGRRPALLVLLDDALAILFGEARTGARRGGAAAGHDARRQRRVVEALGWRRRLRRGRGLGHPLRGRLDLRGDLLAHELTSALARVTLLGLLGLRLRLLRLGGHLRGLRLLRLLFGSGRRGLRLRGLRLGSGRLGLRLRGLRLLRFRLGNLRLGRGLGLRARWRSGSGAALRRTGRGAVSGLFGCGSGRRRLLRSLLGAASSSARTRAAGDGRTDLFFHLVALMILLERALHPLHFDWSPERSCDCALGSPTQRCFWISSRFSTPSSRATSYTRTLFILASGPPPQIPPASRRETSMCLPTLRRAPYAGTYSLGATRRGEPTRGAPPPRFHHPRSPARRPRPGRSSSTDDRLSYPGPRTRFPRRSAEAHQLRRAGWRHRSATHEQAGSRPCAPSLSRTESVPDRAPSARGARRNQQPHELDARYWSDDPVCMITSGSKRQTARRSERAIPPLSHGRPQTQSAAASDPPTRRDRQGDRERIRRPRSGGSDTTARPHEGLLPGRRFSRHPTHVRTGRASPRAS
jgi:hypothetical protein